MTLVTTWKLSLVLRSHPPTGRRPQQSSWLCRVLACCEARRFDNRTEKVGRGNSGVTNVERAQTANLLGHHIWTLVSGKRKTGIQKTTVDQDHRKSLISTTSLVVMPRRSASLPSLDQANSKISSPLKSVSCVAGRPSIG